MEVPALFLSSNHGIGCIFFFKYVLKWTETRRSCFVLIALLCHGYFYYCCYCHWSICLGAPWTQPMFSLWCHFCQHLIIDALGRRTFCLCFPSFNNCISWDRLRFASRLQRAKRCSREKVILLVSRINFLSSGEMMPLYGALQLEYQNWSMQQVF